MSPKQSLCGQSQRAGCQPSISGVKVSAVRWYLLRARVPVGRRVFPCAFLWYFPHCIGSLCHGEGAACSRSLPSDAIIVFFLPAFFAAVVWVCVHAQHDVQVATAAALEGSEPGQDVGAAGGKEGRQAGRKEELC